MSAKAKENIYLLEEMTWPEVEKALKTVKLAIVPAGSTEQHGPHICLSCDYNRAYALSKMLGRKLYPKAFVTPPINVGVSPELMHFPGTMTLRASTLIELFMDYASSMKAHGVTKMIIMNGHGGNIASIDIAIQRMKYELGVTAAMVRPTELGGMEVLDRLTVEGAGHACQFETSEALFLIPDLVRKEKIQKANVKPLKYRHTQDVMPGLSGVKFPYEWEERTADGALGDPQMATAEIGRDLCEAAIRKIAEFAEDFIKG